MTRSRCPTPLRCSCPTYGGSLKRVESLGSYIRSAARATFSAYRTIPIRWRLAGGSAALTFVILACFAAIVGVLTSRQVHSQATDEVRAAVSQLWQVLNRQLRLADGKINCSKIPVRLIDYARPEQAQIRIFLHGRLECTQNKLAVNHEKAPEISLFNTPPPEINGVFQRD